MRKLYGPAVLVLLAIGIAAVLTVLVHGHTVALFDPQGIIARKQRNLIIFTALLSILVVVPVFTLTAVICWKYRADNTKAVYRPDWNHSSRLEIIWWGIPCAIILTLSIVTWRSAHDLDPSKPLVSKVTPLTVQVVALDWKWLFIYPGQHIATVNYLKIPTGTPINFQITSDAPMNSFWIPQLGGQIYAMAGMSTQLHLMADHTGTFRGSSANISGDGFAGMHFPAVAVPPSAFAAWVAGVQHGGGRLGVSEYNALAQPSKDNPPAYYASTSANLYATIVMKYMMPIPGLTGVGLGDSQPNTSAQPAVVAGGNV